MKTALSHEQALFVARRAAENHAARRAAKEAAKPAKQAPLVQPAPKPAPKPEKIDTSTAHYELVKRVYSKDVAVGDAGRRDNGDGWQLISRHSDSDKALDEKARLEAVVKAAGREAEFGVRFQESTPAEGQNRFDESYGRDK